ncbi:hypothetical protein AVEN_162158-1 [Araneus ventricosus]|uniref:Peptidase S1 domain-containing protein n=1 Tax=Araneus ventricosus TaxID=182803 RepID=A0A4Y2CE53_ARAVE|nr:hypothetical protein AVEN_162158-1 [Araneus ventricosus]
MEASFEIQDQDLCRRAYERELNITDVYLCAGTADGSKDSCQINFLQWPGIIQQGKSNSLQKPVPDRELNGQTCTLCIH